MIWRRKREETEGQKERHPASNKQANRVRRSAELSGLIFCISNGKAAVSPSAAATGYQSQPGPRQPGGKHSLLCAHQRSSSPLTQSVMGFRREKKEKSHFPSTLVNPGAPSVQTHKHQHIPAGSVSRRESPADIEATWLQPRNPATQPHVAKQLSASFFLCGSGSQKAAAHRGRRATAVVGKCFLPYSRLGLLTRPPLITAAALAGRPRDSSASKRDETNDAICG